MHELRDREWEPIRISDWFNIRSTGTGIDKIKLDTDGEKKIPYVTRTDSNNGIDCFIPTQGINPDPGGVITIGLDTQTCFFQPRSFYTGQNIQIIEAPFLTLELAMFLVPAFRSMLAKFNWGGNGATLSRLKRSSIMLPVNESGEPDWPFMESYIKERWHLLACQYREYIQQKIEVLKKLSPDSISLFNYEWKEFFIEDICEIHAGVRLTKAEMAEGDIPFIGATDKNNGITNFISNVNTSYKKGVLGVNYNGSVVESFYHPYNAVFSDDVKQLKIKKGNASKYAYLFLKMTILKQKSKYAYGYKFNAQRMRRQKVMLPVDDENEPAWDAMSSYMQSQELVTLQRYLEYLK